MLQVNHLDEIKDILEQYRSIAVVGLSPREDRPSNQVASYMLNAGYSIIPINPGQTSIIGLPCYPNLLALDEKVEIVNIFRRSDQVLPFVEDAISIGVKVIWMQQGIKNNQAATLAQSAGLKVIMDRCIKIDHLQFIK